MQKVVWPTTIVSVDSGTPPKLNAAFSAIPVTMPGSARGRMNSRLTASRPNQVILLMASAAKDPRTSASAVAPSPTSSERPRAVRICSSFHVEANHLSVKPGMGQLWMFDVLNAYTRMRTIGVKRKSSTSATQTRRIIRVQKPSAIRSAPAPIALASSSGSRTCFGDGSVALLESLERAQALRDQQIHGHDHDRHHRHRRRERDVVGDADVAEDHCADQARPRTADQDRRDVVAKRE